MGVHDVAAWVTWLTRDLSLPTPIDVIACSLGGWVAAELATVAPQFIGKLVLVGAAGLKPERGEIFDYFLDSGPTGLRRNLRAPEECVEFKRYWGKELTPEEADLVEQHREMTCRIAWKPYMHSLTLRHLLPGVRTPTLIVWGREDAVVPLNCGNLYQSAIPQARLAVVEACGHMVEMEKPAEFARLVLDFLAA
jgi:pimeloyl-ACP methyl ester carboxylesterase